MPAGTIVVTGGGRGIGAAVSQKLAALGYAVAINYASDKTAAKTTAAKIVAEGGRAGNLRRRCGLRSSRGRALFDDAIARTRPFGRPRQ